MKRMLRLAWVIPVWFIVGCGDLDKPVNEVVKGGEVVVDLSGDVIKSGLIAAAVAGIDATTTVYGYKGYKIPYTTTDEEGNSVEVSGLMVVPTGLPSEVVAGLGLSMVSDSHGTIFADTEAPTAIAKHTNGADGSPIVFTSLGGFVTLQADYIGFGDSSDHHHPFMLKKSLVNTTVDFIKAAQVFALNNDINLNGQLFLTGYSEGGYTALATLERIEMEGSMDVTMAAPMAGPYDVNRTAFGIFTQATLSVPSFLANVGYSYALAYDEELASVINEPYASKLETLFDGSYTRVAIDAELTTVTTGEDGLFNPVFINQFFTNPNHWFRQAVLENNVHTWGPQTTVKLVHCEGDDVIPFGIAQIAEATMNAYGAADVSIVPVEATLGLSDPLGHAECAAMAYNITTKIFAQTRAATIGY
ncbi:MAG: prolyl oligopeptidase family serine peptidase [Sulfurovum sp.]|nr:prolyl oligopeptidase family serine peptidase [Sulfurovum sp.]